MIEVEKDRAGAAVSGSVLRPWGLVLAVLLFSDLGRAEPRFQRGTRESALRGADRVMALIARIEQSLLESTYTHATRVDEKRGMYHFDCSGMASWVLRRAAKRAHAAVMNQSSGGRPLARDFYWSIKRTPIGKGSYGWQRVARVNEAMPGDVIAWLKPEIVRSQNTGHVAFVIEAPQAVPDMPNAYLLRIADASSYQHQDDTRTESGRTGYGTGTILVLADPETGQPAAYGWFGLQSRWVLESKIAIGRPLD